MKIILSVKKIKAISVLIIIFSIIIVASQRKIYKNNSYKDFPLLHFVDWYDATILHTDNLISEMIEKLQNKEALFFYSSDHGESFGEDGRPCLHGYNSSEVWNVPFFIWFSEKYKVKNMENATQITKNYLKINSNKLPKASHDNIFPSILDCVGIESNEINIDYSLCKNQMKATLALQKCERFKDDESAQAICFYKNYGKYQ